MVKKLPDRDLCNTGDHSFVEQGKPITKNKGRPDEKTYQIGKCGRNCSTMGIKFQQPGGSWGPWSVYEGGV